MGDGTRAKIMGVGNTQFATTSKVFHLSNVLHVPTIH